LRQREQWQLSAPTRGARMAKVKAEQKQLPVSIRSNPLTAHGPLPARHGGRFAGTRLAANSNPRYTLEHEKQFVVSAL